MNAALASWTQEARARARRSLLLPHLALLLSIMLWSANATVVKVGVSHVRPIPFMAARFLIGAVLLAVVALATRRELRRIPPVRLLIPAAATGILFNQLGFTYGVSLSTAVDASIIQGIGPPAAAIALFAVSRQRPPRRRLLGLAAGLLGLLLVVASAARGSGGTLVGDAFALVAPISWAIYLLVAANANRTTDATVFLTWTTIFGLIPMIPMAGIDIALEGPGDWLPALPALLYGGLLATALGYGLYFWALARVGVTETALYTYFQPLLGALTAAIFLHEPFGAFQVVGALTIVAAAYLGSWSRVRVPQQAP